MKKPTLAMCLAFVFCIACFGQQDKASRPSPAVMARPLRLTTRARAQRAGKFSADWFLMAKSGAPALTKPQRS